MNIFGFFFSFFVPGFILGMMAMAAVYHEAKKKRRAVAAADRRK